MTTIFLLKWDARSPKKQKHAWCNWLEKKKTEFPTDMHAQCKLSEEKGKFCFFSSFSKNALKRQMIICPLESGDKI